VLAATGCDKNKGKGRLSVGDKDKGKGNAAEIGV